MRIVEFDVAAAPGAHEVPGPILLDNTDAGVARMDVQGSTPLIRASVNGHVDPDDFSATAASIVHRAMPGPASGAPLTHQGQTCRVCEAGVAPVSCVAVLDTLEAV